MKDQVLKLLLDHGTLIEPDAVEFLLSNEDPKSFLEEFLRGRDALPLVLTVDDLRPARSVLSYEEESIDELSDQDSGSEIEEASETERAVPESPEQEIQTALPEEEPVPKRGVNEQENEKPASTALTQTTSELKIISDITGASTCEGSIENFARYFKDRYVSLKRIIRLWQRMRSATTIQNAKRRDGDVKIIGIVNEVGQTKNGHTRLMIEDDTDSLFVLIPKGHRLQSQSIIQDEVLGFEGKIKKNRGGFDGKDSLMFLPDDIIRPGIPANRKPKRTRDDIEILFISDIHVGSSHFLADEFNRLITWLNEGDDVDKIKHIIVAGDLVDGIGIYPNQLEELSIPDIMEQYAELARLLARFPKHMEILLQPGNHDSVRPAEPQPALDPDIQKIFEGNYRFIGNPCFMTLDDVGILAYHGKSVDDLIGGIPALTYQTPMLAMQEMLKRRHLAPIYGGKTPIAPEDKDYLIINPVPDILVTGHIHSTGVENYKGVTMISASAWQAQTPYQLMRNFHPDPAKAIVINLKTGKYRIKDFT